MRLLIVNADDFGLTEAANEGIVDSHRVGSVTSTTLMVNAPATDRAAALALEHPDLGVGLHFNLTWGRPLSDPGSVPALVDANGSFVSRDKLARRMFSGSVPGEQIRLELTAQFERLKGLGVVATHVDSHQHVHAFGAVFEAVATHCAAVGIPMRVPWVASGNRGWGLRRMRRALLAHLLNRATKRWQGRVRWNDGLGSVFDLDAAPSELEDSHYRQILCASEARAFELMVHPVTDARAMEGYTRIGAVGEAEWHYLRTGRLAQVAGECGFRLGSYRDLAT